MLQKLRIKNYALIESLEIDLDTGLTMITGETGAGKSILLGALGLIMGNRADSNQLMNPEKKCIIEAEFGIDNSDIESLFKSLDLDYDANTIVRRELLPSGKSRSFVNDTPVNLTALQSLKPYLIDIHSQHQTLDVTNLDFQYELLDLLSNQIELRSNFRQELFAYKKLLREKSDLENKQEQLNQQYEYNTYMYKELAALDLENVDLDTMEAKAELLENSASIQERLGEVIDVLDSENQGVLSRLYEASQSIGKLSGLSTEFTALHERLHSCEIELQDIAEESRRLLEYSDSNPEELEQVNALLSHVFDLRKKHAALNIAELIEKRDALEKAISQVDDFDQNLELKELIGQKDKKLHKMSGDLLKGRLSVVNQLKDKLQEGLTPLGMANAQFKIELGEVQGYNSFGRDDLTFEFSANKGGHFGSLKKTASGGELSRIMLVIKSILATYNTLPTLIFDEIDTGVSGEVALKMGQIMKNMSAQLQIIAISHLPQVAALGSSHLKVYKEDIGDRTQSFVRVLSQEERVEELAEMLGGQAFGESAINHAKELLLD